MISTLRPPSLHPSRHYSGYDCHSPTDSPTMSHYGGPYQNYPPTTTQQSSSSRFIPNHSSYVSAPPVSAPSTLPQLSPAISSQPYSVPSFYNTSAPPNMSYLPPSPYASASQSYSGIQHQSQHNASEGPSNYQYYDPLPPYSTLAGPHMPTQMVLPSHSSGMQPPPHPHHLHPSDPTRGDVRIRSTSLGSSASSLRHNPVTDFSRSTSPSAAEMANWGYKNEHGTWSCAFPGCTSKSTFQRGCDLRKHYRRHAKTLFCSHPGCPQATEGGFSSKKDRARHEAKHNPQITCEWEGCDRLFSRLDNMKDHVRRIHKKPGMAEPSKK